MLASACKVLLGGTPLLPLETVSQVTPERSLPDPPISSGTPTQQSLDFAIYIGTTLQRPDSLWALGSRDHFASSTHFSGMFTQLSFELVSWPHLVYAQALVSDCWQAEGHRDPVTLLCRGGAQDRQRGSLEVDSRRKESALPQGSIRAVSGPWDRLQRGPLCWLLPAQA